jgi:uncharacterized RDD family membrane protein YckC
LSPEIDAPLPPAIPTTEITLNTPSGLAGGYKRLVAAICDVVFCVGCPLPGLLLLYGVFHFVSKNKGVAIGDLRPSDMPWAFVCLGIALVLLGAFGGVLTQIILLSRRKRTIGKWILRV